MSDEGATSRVVKKRRIPRACYRCQKSKLRCDENAPCARCRKAHAECVYAQKPKDVHTERFERIETELARLSHKISVATSFSQIDTPNEQVRTRAPAQFRAEQQRFSNGPRVIGGSLAKFTVRGSSDLDVLSKQLVTESEARLWFSTFFQGCDRFIPVFDPNEDTYESVRIRNSVLFDVIVIYGARAAHGAQSGQFQALYGVLRQHTSDLILRLPGHDSASMLTEDIQSILVIASFSNGGAVLCDVALRAAVEAGIPNALNSLLCSESEGVVPESASKTQLFKAARIWYYIYVFDLILSLDGGKPPSLSIDSSPRRVRSLLASPGRKPTDMRLLAQVELNALRISAHELIMTFENKADPALAIGNCIKGVILDLDLWLSEWQAVVSNSSASDYEHDLTNINLRIQHAWALLTLHLRALSASGVENIALMAESQRHMALSAKKAAELHLNLILTSVVTESTASGHASHRPYIGSLRYAMEFVWAKNAFSILIVLRLGILLGDSEDELAVRLYEAKEFLHQLENAGVGVSTSHTRILSKIIEKCERAIGTDSYQNVDHARAEPVKSDFQSFIPKEFMFEWDFPGLHLCYDLPIDWQDLFLDLGTLS